MCVYRHFCVIVCVNHQDWMRHFHILAKGICLTQSLILILFVPAEITQTVLSVLFLIIIIFWQLRQPFKNLCD